MMQYFATPPESAHPLVRLTQEAVERINKDNALLRALKYHACDIDDWAATVYSDDDRAFSATCSLHFQMEDCTLRTTPEDLNKQLAKELREMADALDPKGGVSA